MHLADLIPLLRVATMVAWAAVVLQSALSVVRVFRRQAAHYDVIWSLFAAVGAMTLGFSLRWFIAADNALVYSGLYVFSLVLACAIVMVIRTYERHGHG